MSMRTVILEDLSAENKQRAWQWLKENKPTYAQMIKDDPGYKHLLKTFNGKSEVEVDADILLRAGQAG